VQKVDLVCRGIKEAGRGWYVHRFYDFQPDSSTPRTRNVQAEISRYGGSGFHDSGARELRMDAVVPLHLRDAKGCVVCESPVEAITTCDVRPRYSCNGGRATPLSLAASQCAAQATWEYFGHDGDEYATMMFNYVNKHRSTRWTRKIAVAGEIDGLAAIQAAAANAQMGPVFCATKSTDARSRPPDQGGRVMRYSKPLGVRVCRAWQSCTTRRPIPGRGWRLDD